MCSGRLKVSRLLIEACLSPFKTEVNKQLGKKILVHCVTFVHIKCVMLEASCVVELTCKID